MYKRQIKELDSYKKALEINGVDVYELDSVPNCNQIFARDIGFVIGDYFFVSNILPLRHKEINGLNSMIKKIDNSKIVKLNTNIHIEGGDIILDNDYIFVGYYNKDDYEKQITARTNLNAVKFLQKKFTNKKVKAFELRKSIADPSKNALHLDCCFQPVSRDKAVVCREAFANKIEFNFLMSYYGQENIFELTLDEMSKLYCNFLSISENTVITDKRFKRLTNWFDEIGLNVEKIDFSEISKLGGLFRCCTLPLIRENN